VLYFSVRVSSNLGQWFAAGGDVRIKQYMIVSKLNGLALDVKYGSKKPGARLTMWHKNGGDNQQWFDNGGRIRSKLNGLCLSIEGSTILTLYAAF